MAQGTRGRFGRSAYLGLGFVFCSTLVGCMDGDKKPLRVLVSNPAHTLWTGIIAPEYAGSVVKAALSEELYSGWGLRTLGTQEVRFNPVSYHNGSVWPHDTALALAGMARYGEREGVAQVLCDLFHASKCFDNRMPELFCGFTKEPGEPPIAYPVACMPQAWAAGAA